MLKGIHDVFALVINLLGVALVTQTCHHRIIWNIKASFGNKFDKIIDSIWVEEQNNSYVKDEGINLNFVTKVLNFFLSYEITSLKGL
jgi:hypothetical protein